jgi:putative peptidoglycan lipid II flippase
MMTALAARLGGWQRGSANGRVLSAAAVVAVFTLATRLAGAAKEIVVAQRFGTSDEVDAFLLAFLLPSFAMAVIGGSLSTALIPAYVEVRQHQGQAAAQRLFSTVMLLCVGLLAGAALLLAALVPALVPLFGSNFSSPKIQLTVELSYLVLPCLVFTGVATIWSAVLNAHGSFAPGSAAALAVPLAIIVALLLAGGVLGIRALPVGLLAGSGVHAALVGVALRREGLRLMPRWDGYTAQVHRVVGQYLPMAAGMLVMELNPVINTVMAAQLPAGSVASLGYGNKLVAFGMGVGSVSIGAAVLPHFSSMVASRDWRELRGTLRTYAAAVLAVTIPVTALGMVLSEPIARLLFQRGAFTSADTLQVARIQMCYLAQLPFHLTGMLFVRFISAVSSNRALMWVSMGTAFVNVAGNYILSKHLGAAGIALSTSLVYASPTWVWAARSAWSARSPGPGWAKGATSRW